MKSNDNNSKWISSDPINPDVSSVSSAAATNIIFSQQQKIYSLETKIDAQDIKIAKFRTTIRNYSSNIDSMNKKLEENIQKSENDFNLLKKGVNETRNKTLEPLAIFVGLFTFASISFQVFANVKDFEIWSALLIIIAGILTIFSGLVIHATSISTDVESRRRVTGSIILLGLFLVIIGSGLYIYGNQSVSLKYSNDCVELKQVSPESTLTYCKIP